MTLEFPSVPETIPLASGLRKKSSELKLNLRKYPENPNPTHGQENLKWILKLRLSGEYSWWFFTTPDVALTQKSDFTAKILGHPG